MRIQVFRAAAAAFLVAAAMGLTATGPAEAQSVMKECGSEWQAAKANNTTNGQTWQEFLKGCRARHASAPAAAPSAAPAAVPAAAPAPAPMAPAPAQTAQPAPAPMAPAPMKPMAKPTGAGQFSTETEAKSRCPNDTVVWLNIKSHIYHYPGTRSYGTTKQGAYMCEADAVAAGDRASKSRIGKKAQQ
ncbi:hypothetical protein [Roseiarcus sp.]|uniref:hypothetical protein n=1 Tax=Roseiarcus sp. TaxID=1969460 RepID=UPI003F9EAD07